MNVKGATIQIGFLFLMGVLLGCTPALSHLEMADQSYRKAKYEEAQFWLGKAERKVFTTRGLGGAQQLSLADQTHFHFLQGMTAARLGNKGLSRYHLSMAALSKPEVLDEQDQAVLRRLLPAGVNAKPTNKKAP